MIRNTLTYKNHYIVLDRYNDQTKRDLLNIIDTDFLRVAFEHTDYKSIQLSNVLYIFNEVYQLHLLNDLNIEQKQSCWHCNNYFDINDLKYIGSCDKYLCADCLKNHYSKCEICGNIHNNRDLVLFENQMICKNCLCDKGYYITNCRHCNKKYIYKIDTDNRQEKMLCNDCINDYIFCLECGTCYPKNETEFVGDICKNCYIKFKKRKCLKEYGHKPEPCYKQIKNEVDFMGIEFETELSNNSSYNKYDLAFAGTELTEDFIYAKTDGSLNNGVEFVTHPISYKAWCSTYLERFNNELLEKIKALGIVDRPTRAGIHIHYNKADLDGNEHIKKICYVLSKPNNYAWLTKFCRRNEERIKRWAKPHYIDSYGYQDFTPSTSNRYHVVNLCNKNTIEFRCFSSTANIVDIQAFIVFTKNVVEYCRNISIEELDKTELKDIAICKQKTFMQNYLKKRRLL